MDTKTDDANAGKSANVSGDVNNDSDSTDATGARPVITYITIGLVVVIIAILIYFGYRSFVGNSDKCDEESAPDKDEAITDFNLRDAIRRLQEMQKRIMNTLSDNSNI